MQSSTNKKEISITSPYIHIYTFDLDAPLIQGGPEPARPGQQREDAAIQVTPPPPTVSAMQNLKIDLSNVCQSDASLSYTPTNGCASTFDWPNSSHACVIISLCLSLFAHLFK